MTYEAAHNLMRSRFNTMWAGATPIAWPNVRYDPTPGTAYVKFHIADADARQASMGDPDNNTYRHPGILYVMVFTPIDSGDQEALSLADSAAAIFRGWRDGSVGIQFFAPSIRRIGADGKWYQTNVLCPFQRDSFF